jgi:adenylate cyclase
MQETLSRSIVGALKLELSPPEDHDLSRRPIKSLRAYDLYLLGRHHWHRFTQVDTEKAIELYQQAIAVDPNFALAYGGLAAAYLTISGPGVPGLPARVGIPKVRASAEKALLLDPNTVFGGVSLGFVHAWYDLDWEKAGRLFSRIVGANPGSSEAHEAYAMYLSTRGMQDEAMQHMEVAIDLDPLWPIYSVNAAEILYMSRKFDESSEYCRRALELDPSFAWAHIQMAMARIQKGEYEQAIDQIEDRVDPRFPWGAQFLGYAYAKSGRNANALQVLGRLESLLEEGFASAANLALVHLGLGEENQALDHLEVALDEQPPGSTALAYLGVEPAWDPLRSHERFQQVLARIGMGPQEINRRRN